VTPGDSTSGCPKRKHDARADLGPFGGGFLLYLRMHDNPTDMAAVLRDYSKDMILPARSSTPTGC